MIVNGVDIVEIDRFGRALARWGDPFLNRIFTNAEIACYRRRLSSLAAHFAAKEAVMKALGWGYRHIGWHDIEILPDEEGKPKVYLFRRARERAQDIGLQDISLSISHTTKYALASAIGLMNKNNEDC